jgi:hypothetical protein
VIYVTFVFSLPDSLIETSTLPYLTTLRHLSSLVSCLPIVYYEECLIISNPTGASSFDCQLAHGYYQGPAMSPPGHPMQLTFVTGSSHSGIHKDQTLTLHTAGPEGQVIPVGGMNSSLGPSVCAPSDHIPEEEYSWYAAGQVPSTPGPSLSQDSVDGHPFINKAPDLAKKQVASYLTLMASSARRTNPGTHVCDICQATFTRPSNLGCRSPPCLADVVALTF